jgi:hypothetical protein
MLGAHGKRIGGWAVGGSGRLKIRLFFGLCYKVGGGCFD